MRRFLLGVFSAGLNGARERRQSVEGERPEMRQSGEKNAHSTMGGTHRGPHRPSGAPQEEKRDMAAMFVKRTGGLNDNAAVEGRARRTGGAQFVVTGIFLGSLESVAIISKAWPKTFLNEIPDDPLTPLRAEGVMGVPPGYVYGTSDEVDFEIHMERIGKELQCRICMAAYDDAVMTLCDHYFCQACVTSAFAAKKNPTCPLCKAPCTRRELRVDKRMRSLVKTYRSILASHRIKNTYCSQLPPSQTQKLKQNEKTLRSRNKVSVGASMPPPPPRMSLGGDSPEVENSSKKKPGSNRKNKKSDALKNDEPETKTSPNEKRGDSAKRVCETLEASVGGSVGKRPRSNRRSGG